MTARERVDLHGSENTMLMTLYVRAVDAGSRHPVLGDPTARAVLDRIAYDPWRLRLFRGNLPALVARARLLDERVQAYLDRHDDAVVVHLACGLDGRSARLALPPTVTWFDLDQPEVVDLRRRLYPELPGVTMIAGSATNPSWWAQVPPGRPTLVVAEGLLMYLDRAGLTAALTPVITRPGPTTLMADTVASWVRRAASGPLVSRALGAGFASTSGDVDRVLRALAQPGRAAPRLVEDVAVAEVARRWTHGADKLATTAADLVPGVRGAMRVRVWEIAAVG